MEILIDKLSARVVLVLTCLAIASSAGAQARFCATNSTFLFGDRPIGNSTSTTATISNCGNQPLSFTDVSVDPATGPAYHVNATCRTGLTLAPGAACSVTVTFAPTVPGQTSGAVWLHNTTNTPDQLLTFYGRGVDSQAGTATLSFSPGALPFGTQMVGTQSPGLTVQLVNQGPGSLTPSALVVNGPAAYDYSAEGTCNVGTPIAAGKSCALTFFFTPAALGSRPANLVVDSPQLSNLAILPDRRRRNVARDAGRGRRRVLLSAPRHLFSDGFAGRSRVHRRRRSRMGVDAHRISFPCLDDR